MPRLEARPQRYGSHEYRNHGAIRAYGGGGEARDRVVDSEWSQARREWIEDHHDVRNPLERAIGGAIPGAFRRFFHRLERLDANDAGARPRLGPGRRIFR